MPIEVKVSDQRFYELFDPNQELVRIAADITSGEGPIWHQKEQCLYFSDIAASKTMRYSEAGGLELAFNNGIKANGLFVNLDGRLLMCEYATSSIAIRNTDGTKRKVLADYYGDVELMAPNDIIQRSDGLIYFSDPTYGRHNKPSNVERPFPSDFRAVYCYNPETKTLIQAASGFENPNGLCFSPDEKLLYIADTPPQLVYKFNVQPDGTLIKKTPFCKCPGRPDGMKVDERGNLLLAGQSVSGLEWYTPDGTLLGVITIPGNVLNLAWGGTDYKTLFVTCRTDCYKMRTLVAGYKCC